MRDSTFRKATGAGRWAALLPGTLFSFGVNLLTLTLPIYMMQVFDRVMASRSVETLLMLAAMALLALAAMSGLEAARARLLARVGAWLHEALGAPALARGLRAGGENAGAALRDLQIVRQFFGGPSLPPLLDAPWTPLFLLVVFFVHPALGGLALGGAALLLLFALVNEWATRRAFASASAATRGAIGMAEAAARNVDALQAMGMTDAVVARWRSRDAEVGRRQDEAEARSAAIGAAARFFRFGLQVAILGVGAWLAIEGAISPGAMLAASIIVGRALAPAEQAIVAWKGVVAARDAYRRLARLFESTGVELETLALPPPLGRVRVEQASYTPRGAAEAVLRGVSFALEPGEMLALIGPSAAGKSTLAKLLVGSLAPSAGHVRLDGAEVSAWASRDRGRHVGYLPQDVELFDATVRENIARLEDCADAEVVQAAQLAGAHELILRLPNGYETPIGAGGARLSGGQRQRIALARALFRAPPFVVLDEPNASLDREGEEALMAALAAMKARGATIVMVAHRPSVLALADKVLVLRDGRVEAFGGREEVMSRFAPGANVVAARRERPLETKSRAHG